MKILKLKFKNINSLAGEHEIDFTHPVFTNDGLFAITGKTGAGKSTILDAISLAFYGRTPRVKITGSENEVMTKGENECFAEILFEVAGKKWKSSLRQNRAGTGRLNPVSRTIADFDNNIIAEQVNACNDKIVEILGLSFEQFTKVVLLAQGSFAAFLEAEENDKGALLEKITGTEIYGIISEKVFERCKIEKEKLDNLVLELNTVNILSKEEKEHITNEIYRIQDTKKLLDTELQHVNAAINWLSELAFLQTQIREAQTHIPVLELQANAANVVYETCASHLESARTEQERQSPLFNRVRALDIQIAEKDLALNPILQFISELEENIRTVSTQLANKRTELGLSETELAQKQQWAETNQRYENLVTTYLAIENENQALVTSQQNINSLNVELKRLQNELEQKQATTRAATENFTTKNTALEEIQNELNTKRLALTELLGGRQITDLQTEKEKLTHFGLQIHNLIEVKRAISKNRQEINQLNENLNQFETSKSSLERSIESGKNRIENLVREISTLEENIRLKLIIQTMEEHRLHLRDGEACPLCGSQEHPFAEGNIPVIGNEEQLVATLKQQLTDTTEEVQQNKLNLERAVADNTNSLINKAREEQNVSENLLKQEQLVAELKETNPTFSVPEVENSLVELQEIQNKTERESVQIQERITSATVQERQINTLSNIDLPKLQREREEAMDAKNQAEIGQQLAEQAFITKQETAKQEQETYNVAKKSFLEKLNQYDVENIEQLHNCLTAWNENKAQKDTLQTQITILTGDIALGTQQLENLTNILHERKVEKQNVETNKQTLTQQRSEIFGEKSVEIEENRLNQLIAEKEQAKAAADLEKNTANTALETKRAILTERENELNTKRAQNITDRTIEELQQELNEKSTQSEIFSQNLGAHSRQLKDDEQNRRTFEAKLAKKENQQLIHNKWGKLNELIGSKDGKKYRNFAQALTFEHLVNLSNIQLKKMSERYMLKRKDDDKKSFELSVIDHFHDDIERPVQNLSGGEKFIVSLSLALGLANMASRNMQIDTMFIDEGFGTLDSDYLDVALNALSNLQSEGKIIGVISHLSELKERIATHVEVIPSGNGHSRIQITN